MCDKNTIINIKNFYFTEHKRSSEQSSESNFKEDQQFKNLQEVEDSDEIASGFIVYEEKPNVVHTSKSVQTECNTTIEMEVQTDLSMEDINKMKSELNRVKAENARLLCDIKEICMLVGIAKITGDKELDMDKIKRHLTLVVNREIRQHTPIPYINVDFLSKKSSLSKDDKIFIL